MSAPNRPGMPVKRPTMRPPTSMRPPPSRTPSRAQTATPSLTGRPSEMPPSPAQSVQGGKRKERDFDHQDQDHETNINVVVRCRGRNDRELRENSGVVVSTEGVKGKKVELSMGPSALSNKTYQFDKVFSPAADQAMLFDDVVEPILDEVLGGFNCTIFAYGQTGTGKTYTMSGDITDMQPLPDSAGIIPRVLYSLFNKLGEDNESSVKCSFIELYNEELRDLLSTEDHAKLKIYDDNSKKGQTTTLVQGMEESHIKTASKGLELLRSGSHKRQVAATKCNDLSSRSHTVFTITVYMKRTTETGEDFVSAGKLNLVDLAGSENIQRSGAENKRAAEAGLINKSLLTLGRVINALVEKSSHIPYRESKLTRLLQDSLGGRTKTCIIATLSPAKSNLEETISTLDYAFRAKNIRNKPQINQMVTKKTLLKEFTMEIEKLKSELIATRQRNGVYLTQEAYEEITVESESRRILCDEQKDKIETMETNLRNKVQELFSLTTNFNGLRKENEQAKLMLDGTKSLLEKTEVVLTHTRRSLTEETFIRKAHQKTESKLAGIGEDLLATLSSTTTDISGLHSKIQRKADLHSLNRNNWTSTKTRVTGATSTVEDRVETLRQRQEQLLTSMSTRMQGFVSDELQELQQSQRFLQEKAEAFQRSEKEVNIQTAKARDDVNEVLEEIKTLREDVKQNVGNGLNDLSAAAQRITAGISTELENFHTQLHASYVSLGREFKSIFDDVVKQLSEQQAESERLRQQILTANSTFMEAGQESRQTFEEAMEEERRRAASDREKMLSQISSLITSSAEAQERRITEHIAHASKRVKTSEDDYSVARETYNESSDALVAKSRSLIDSCVRSRENVKSKIKGDWTAANDQTEKIKATTEVVHGETVRIVDTQMSNMDTQLISLDEIVSRIRAQNDTHHTAHTASLAQLSSDVQQSYSNIGTHMETSYTRTQGLDTDMQTRTADLASTLPELSSSGEIVQTLHTLRDETNASELTEYVPTGQTPAKTAYSYPTALPRTANHESLLDRLRNGSSMIEESPIKESQIRSSPKKRDGHSPSKAVIYTDSPVTNGNLDQSSDAVVNGDAARNRPRSLPGQGGLREIDVNVNAASLPEQPESRIGMLKRNNTMPQLDANAKIDSKLPMKRPTRMTAGLVAEGRENVGAAGGPGRRLRPRGSD
ncbi:kinesin-domain-containing protein [Aureobasidium pullulans]|nr:kinesin-domain-containing protein [Aureobasidium pullulans]